MRVILDGPALAERPAGPGVHLRSLACALAADDSVDLAVRQLGLRRWIGARAAAAAIHPRLRSRALPVPDSLVRRMQSTLGVPTERTLLGRYDVYHQFHADADPAVPDERLVVTLHDTVALHWPEEEGAMAPESRRLLHRCAAVVTVSQFAKGEICAEFGLPPEKVHVIYNGVDSTRFAPEPAAEAGPVARRALGLDGPFLLFVGGGTPRKNVAGLLAAFSILRSGGDLAVDLVLAGPVERSAAEFRANLPARLRHRVHFVGFVDDDLMPGLYAEASALVSPSLYEGFGLPVAEAMACGIPVVVSDRSALPEIAGPAAMMADPDVPEEIAHAIAHVVNEPDIDRKQRRELGLDWVRRFSWLSAARQTVALYGCIAG